MGKNLTRAPYGTADWFHTTWNPTPDWLLNCLNIKEIKLICLKSKKKNKRTKNCAVTWDRTGARCNPELGVQRAVHSAIKSFKKIPQKNPLYFMGKNLSRAPYGTPDWSRYSGKGTPDWLIKKSGKNSGRAGKLGRTTALYQTRREVIC
jgi:hypothetical protein